jgi:penicillin-binding protein 1A
MAAPANMPMRALERRNWVLDQMVKRLGHATEAEAAAAKAQPLGVIARRVEL